MSKKIKETANSLLTLETIDKLNLIKIDVSFMSNLLMSWNLNQNSPTYDDMHGMSRVCDSINEQLNQCGSMLDKIKDRS